VVQGCELGKNQSLWSGIRRSLYQPKKSGIQKLTGLKDDEKNEVAVNRIYDKDDIPPGPYKDNCPDLITGYNEGYRVSWDSAVGKVGTVIFEDNKKAWSGDHCIDPALVPGIFLCNRKINSDKPAIIDIAPTALKLFGVDIPGHMDGKPLIDNFQSIQEYKKVNQNKKKSPEEKSGKK
jgi:predicted AlkP superfamily phosphohydrolase/phosphomutase